MEENKEIHSKKDSLTKQSDSVDASYLFGTIRQQLEEEEVPFPGRPERLNAYIHQDLKTREASVHTQMKIVTDSAVQEISQSCHAFIKDIVETAKNRIADMKSAVTGMAPHGLIDGVSGCA